MWDLSWNFTFKETKRQVKMCETQKPTKLWMKIRAREIIVRKVEFLNISKMKKGTVRIEYTFKTFTAKVEANHVTSDGVTRDTIPWAAIGLIFPCCCFQKRISTTIIIIFRIYSEGWLEMKQSRALIMMTWKIERRRRKEGWKMEEKKMQKQKKPQHDE